MLFGEDKHVDFVLEGDMTNLRIVPKFEALELDFTLLEYRVHMGMNKGG